MGKIPIQDLARMMGIPHQDLTFKLKSIGVRVEGDDAQIDTDTLQAILQGKKLPHPREVILRDGETPAGGGPLRRPNLPPPRRLPQNPLRPGRPRTMIQRVESRIKTLPASERPAPKPEEVVKPPVVEEAPTPPAAPPAEAPPVEAKVEAPKPDTAKPKAKPAAPPAATPDKKVRSLKKATVSRDPGGFGTARPGGSLRPSTATSRAAAAGRRGGGKRRSDRSSKEAPKRQQVEALAFKDSAPEGPVMISEGMTVREFAEKLGVKSKDLIKTLFQRGIMANINNVLNAELAQEVATELGVETMVVSFEEEVQFRQEMEREEQDQGTDKVPRAPVVTIMGHVDHGKTSLLDCIRSSQVTESEFGGITQHIGAYAVEAQGRKIVFLDTPGHEAFTLMRSRGAQVTDIVILVVAADDAVMPQTIEAIDHARAAKVPIIVAINKIDKANANPDRVKKELADQNLLVEDWGGDVVSVPISALKNEGISDLLEMILLQADILELKANDEVQAQGVVLEARKEVGRGVVATVLVQNGTLNVGDSFVTGMTWGRVRAMANDLGERLKEAPPATPVELTGFQGVPEAGDTFQVLEDENKARGIAEFRANESRQRSLTSGQAKLSLDQLFNRIESGEVKELPVVLKADVQGSVEVLKDAIVKLSTSKVSVRVIGSGVGGISTNDVLLASASEAIVVGFNVRPERIASDLAEKEAVDLRLHTVIYELIDELRKAMAGLLEPTFKEVNLGRAEVRNTFKVPKFGSIAGCHVVDGLVRRNAAVRLLRDHVVIYEGKIASLRRFKDDATEVRNGFDCGIGLERYQDIKPGDIIEAYTKEEVAATL
ncbi:MAG: translation initiation factor IF-2 [Deltaproteobacteria bacterium]|nr:translation initiation factor IF-2 [Deltaproteobacteria bacterium]